MPEPGGDEITVDGQFTTDEPYNMSYVDGLPIDATKGNTLYHRYWQKIDTSDFRMPYNQPKYMKVIGRIHTDYRAKMGGTPKTHDFLKKFYLKKGITPEQLRKFNYMFDNPRNVEVSVLKYDGPDLDDSVIDRQAAQKADFYMENVFLREHFGTKRIFEWDEVTYQPTTSPGPMLKDFDIKTKREAFECAAADIQDFWENAHIYGYPCIWSVSGKNELLKEKKIVSDDIRTFISPDAGFAACCKRLYLDQNNGLHYKKFGDFMCGFSKHRRGWNDLKEYLMHGKPRKIIETDLRKWDSNMMSILFDRIRRWRWMMYKPEFQTPENKLRHDYYYQQIQKSKMKLPNGYVVQKEKGNPSGSDNTTEDNCLGNLWSLAYSYFRIYPEKNIEDFILEVVFALYADDMVLAVSDSEGRISIDTLKQAYGELGMEIDQTKSKEQENMDGITFLGSEFRQRFIYGQEVCVPVPNREKMLCSLFWRAKQCTYADLYQISNSLAQESFFDDYLFGFFQDLSREISSLSFDELGRDEYKRIQMLKPTFPTRDAMMSLYLGL